MGWFTRTRKLIEPEDRTPDPTLAALTVPEANLLRAEVRHALAERGQEAEVFGGHVRTTEGTYGLDNLMRKVRGEDRSAWPQIVREHVGSVLAPVSVPSTDEERAARITARLFDVTESDPHVDLDYAPEWQEGIAEILTLDFPDRVQILAGDSVAELSPLGPWYRLARQNLRRQLADAEVAVERVSGDGGQWIDCAIADNVYVASGALLLDEVLAVWQPSIDLGNGVLFAVPCRNQLAFRACDSAEAVLSALTLLPRFTIAGYGQNVGPLSPHVYHWRDGVIEQVTRLDGAKMTVQVGPELAGMLEIDD